MGNGPKCLSPTPCPVFGLILKSISEPKVILLELKQTLINDLANTVSLKKETVKGKGVLLPEACELFSSRAGGLGLLNPHR